MYVLAVIASVICQILMRLSLYGDFVQVNLFQKRSFLHQLTHNMTTDCSLNYKFSTRKIQVQNMLCTKIVLNAKTKQKTIFVHNMV